jgi:bifunctional UDP-N-acetylglucosamine pyrophosphorylase/glucosamine-1-phosphate N-acetyltransferase
MTVKTIILAAGQGTRMRSSLPKVLHKVANRSLLQHVYDTSKLINENEVIIIYGHGGALVRETLASLDAQWIEQKEQLGTGHAVLQADSLIENEDTFASKLSMERLVNKGTSPYNTSMVSSFSIKLSAWSTA